MKITIRQYAQLLLALEKETGEKIGEKEIKKMAFFIRKNKDVKKIDKIFKKYQQLKKEENGMKEAVVFSREKLSDEKIEEIKRVIAEKKSVKVGKINISNEIDGSIGGGLIIRIENEIWDGSLKAKMEKIKNALAR